jgi:hypothetical protein
MSYELHASDMTAVPGQPVPLAISLEPEPLHGQALVIITGLPQGARLNAGVDAGGEYWLLPARRLNGLTLTSPKGTAGTVRLEVQLLDRDARMPLSNKSKFEVRMRPPAPVYMDAPPGELMRNPYCRIMGCREAENLIPEGNNRMREGDILEAREFYMKAFSLGAPEAALAMGRSYDPVYLQRIEKKNAEPDAVMALEWYKKAHSDPLYIDPAAGELSKRIPYCRFAGC